MLFKGILLDFLHFLLKLVPVSQRIVLDGHLVIIDGAQGIMQQAGDVLGVVDTHADEGENAQFRIQLPRFFQGHPGLRTEEGVEMFHKVRMQVQEGFVEDPVEAFQGVVGPRGEGKGVEEFFRAPLFQQFPDAVLVLLDLLHAGGEVLQELDDVALFDLVGVPQAFVRHPQAAGLQGDEEDGHAQQQHQHGQQDVPGQLPPAQRFVTRFVLVFNHHEELGNLPGPEFGIVQQRVFLGNPQIVERAVHVRGDEGLGQEGQGGVVLDGVDDVALGR